MNEFTDEQILMLTARAIGRDDISAMEFLQEGHRGGWEPLIDNAQCMKLIKRFKLGISRPKQGVITVMDWETRFAESKDYNRAICECVARGQFAKESSNAVLTGARDDGSGKGGALPRVP